MLPPFLRTRADCSVSSTQLRGWLAAIYTGSWSVHGRLCFGKSSPLARGCAPSEAKPPDTRTVSSWLLLATSTRPHWQKLTVYYYWATFFKIASRRPSICCLYLWLLSIYDVLCVSCLPFVFSLYIITTFAPTHQDKFLQCENVRGNKSISNSEFVL